MLLVARFQAVAALHHYHRTIYQELQMCGRVRKIGLGAVC